jgi:hypothetical protein
VIVLRLLGVALVFLGIGMIGPLSTRGPTINLRKARPSQLGIDFIVWFRIWLFRVGGVLAIVGGIIYIVHPPPN